MGIQINGQTDTISASDGGLSVSGMDLSNVTSINASGIITATSANVGSGITLSGTQINVGSATTIHSGGFRIGSSDLHSAGLSIASLNSSGVSTFSSGPVLIGTGSATGTSSQPLQVTGGAYVSGNLGIGTTVTNNKLDVSGDIAVGNVSGGAEGGQITIRDASGTASNALNIDIDGSNNSRIFNSGNGNLSIGNLTGGSGSVKLYTNASERFSIDSSGRITMPSQVYVYASSATRSGTANPVSPPHYPFTTYSESYDVGSNFNATTGVFTAPVTGKYLIMGTWSQDANTGRTIGTLSFNGNYEEWVEGNNAYDDETGSRIRVLAANDTVSFGSQNAALGSIVISIWLLG